MTVQIATDDHEDLKAMVAILEAGVAPWPAYSWKPRWPQPWILVLQEDAAQQLVTALYGQSKGLAQVVAVQAGLEQPALPAPPAAPLGAAPVARVAVTESAPVVKAAPVPAPVKKAAPTSKKAK